MMLNHPTHGPKYVRSFSLRTLRLRRSPFECLESRRLLATLGMYEFDGEVLTPSGVAANVTFSDFAYDGTATPSFPAGNGSSDALAANQWPTDATQTNKFTFSVGVDVGFQLDVTAVVLDHLRSSTGPTSYEVRVNGASLGSSSVGDVSAWQDADSFGPGGLGLTGTVTVEIFASMAEGSTGSWRVDNVVLDGVLDPISGGCSTTVTETADVGTGSLREAIDCANSTAGLDTIRFNIPGAGPHTIEPLSPLPTITDPAVLDGATQPGFAGVPLVELNGSLAGLGANGLSIEAGDTTVRGLAINRFDHSALRISGGDGNVVQGNYLGTDVAGAVAQPNGGGGNTPAEAATIAIVGSSNNLIGGASPGEGNLISGGAGDGILIASAANNVVQGNHIGADVSGTMPLGNASFGVWLAADVNDSTIGGQGDGEANVIAFNGDDGVVVGEAGSSSPSAGNAISGNSIHSNAGIAIDLGDDGPTSNDPDDPDAGPNNLQNFPQLEAAVRGGSSLTIDYAVPSVAPNSEFPLTIEFFLADAGSGRQFLGWDSYVGPGDATAMLSTDVVVAGDSIVAAATDAAGNTSEFSLPVVVDSAGGPEADLAVTKTDVVDPVRVGDQIEYLLSVVNNGPDAATNVVLTDELPGDVDFVSAAPDTGNCTEAAGLVSCNLGDLAAGDGLEVVIRATAVSGGELSNTASVASDTVDPIVSNNSATETTLVATSEASVDVVVRTTQTVDSVLAGCGSGNLVFVVTAANLGPDDATGVALSETITLPSGVIVDTILPSISTSYTPSDATSGTWVVGELASGEIQTLTVVLTARQSASPGSDVIVNTAAVVGVDQTDSNSDNNAATSTASVLQGVLLQGGALSIVGTDEADGIEVREIGGLYRVRVNAPVSDVFLDPALVDRIEINACGGDDEVAIRTNVNRPSVIRGGEGDDLLSGGSGDDEIYGGPGRDVLRGFAGHNTLNGGDGDDELIGGARAETIIDLDGNNLIQGRAGADDITAGPGDDEILGGDGNDSINAGEGNNIVQGGVGRDQIVAGGGNDLLRGGPGSDFLDGGAGNDQLFGDEGFDTLLGGLGDDQLRGGDGRDVLIGGGGQDDLAGDTGQDLLIAGATIYDDDRASLSLIADEWHAGPATAVSYGIRVANLRSGGGLLAGSGVRLEAGTTVLADDDIDLLSGSGALDYFFADTGGLDEILDLEAGEEVDAV